jgi:hypothetical protein
LSLPNAKFPDDCSKSSWTADKGEQTLNAGWQPAKDIWLVPCSDLGNNLLEFDIPIMVLIEYLNGWPRTLFLGIAELKEEANGKKDFGSGR